MDVTVYTFEDEDGNEFGAFYTYDATEAEEYGRSNHVSVVANEYEWVDSEIVDAWDFANRLGGDDEESET